jgi:AraC-like DNA-binding protein
MSARGRSATVTEIAAGLGFVELRRFSVEYLRMFGESPSETLRRSFRDPGGGNRDLNDRVTFRAQNIWPGQRRAIRATHRATDAEELTKPASASCSSVAIQSSP